MVGSNQYFSQVFTSPNRRQELFWSLFFGWQRVALGAIIVAIVVFFPMGLMGWMRERWPERFGERVDQSRTAGLSEGGGS